jgi:lysophospholipase L1-like esterase
VPETEIIPPIDSRTRRRGAREALICIGVCALVLAVCEGASVKREGERMDPGPIRTGVLAVGRPLAWLAGRLPFAGPAHDATAWLSPDENLADEGGGFATVAAHTAAPGVAPVTPDAFPPGALGPAPPPRRALRTLLVTGDSMAMPLDAVLARRLEDGRAIQVDRDPHIGTGISKSDLLDWGKLSVKQVTDDRPGAVVVFIGANEGFPMRGADRRLHSCCGAQWAAIYATRVRTMMNTYRRGGLARVYWLLLPMPRDPRRATIARAVNAAVRAAAAPYEADVRVLDMSALFTPGGRYRASMPVAGENQLVREPDGIHLNETGSELAADAVLRAMASDFTDATSK